jgi:hypothetical protein
VVVSIGPGAESVGVLLWAAKPGAARWGRATWGGAAWSSPGWQTVGCDVGEVTQRWGASQESGILSVAEAGELDLGTIDPARELDPLNTASPYYGAVRPGVPVRIVGYSPAERILSTGFIDEASYDLASARGRIRAVDGLAYLAQAQLPAMALPNTLRARVRAIVAAVGLGSIVPVQPETIVVELLVNGSFEPDAAGWTNVGGAAGSGSVAVSGAPGGARALRVVGGAGYPQYTQRVPSLPGLSYVAKGWTSRPTGSLPGSIIPAAFDAAGTLLLAAQLDGISTGGQWDYLESAPFVTPANTAWMEIDLRIHAAATTAADAPLFDLISLTGQDVTTVLEPDPPVAPHDGTAKPAWQAIADAAQDALVYVWIDPTGMLRFRSWGSFIDAPISIGCPPADADPGDPWLLGLSTIETTASGDAVRNSVRAYSSGTTFTPAVTDPGSIATYGPRPFDVERIVPAFATWADRVLKDRGDAGLDIGVGEVRPYTVAELDALLATQLGGPSVIRVRDDAHGELVDLDVGMIGARVGVTPAGWRFAFVTLVSRVEWDAITPEPPVPPIPPPDPWHVETRTYIGTSDALIALTSGGAKYGAGASTSLPFGAWSGWTYRSLLRFPAIPWTKVRAIRTATLKVRTTTQVRIGFGSSPKTELRRITSDWSAGSASSPSSGNAVVWPGPNTTSSGAVTASMGTAQNADKAIRVDAIVRAWAPASAGGSGASQLGIRLGEVSSSGSNTGEVWPVEQGGSARPTLELVVEVFD